MIRAEYGGCGKSYACKSLETKGHKVLFVCTTNKLANNYKEHGCTINKFFGIGLTEKHQYGQDRRQRLRHHGLRRDIILLRKEP
ncbi:MAG: hypothetical protein ACKPKO_14910, partial [Candidatus Fonsibacter sp.]